jgi:hypothetical protein
MKSATLMHQQGRNILWNMVEFETSSESKGLFELTYLNLFTGIKTRETVLERSYRNLKPY